MSNLLDKASILLSPTAYNNGSMLSVKPENGDGDFTFVRGSAATRVNAQGLVENVQIISSELVSNGDFSNGSTGWTLGSQWSIVNETAVLVGDGSFSSLEYPIAFESGKTYRVEFDVIAISGNGKFQIQQGALTEFSTAGSYSYDVTVTNTPNSNIQFARKNGSVNMTLDNISVKEVTEDTNLPRINYEGFSYDGNGDIIPDSGCGSWLLEPQSTNLVPYSQDFSNSSWSKTNSTIVSNSTTSPSGDLNADKVVETSSLSYTRVRQNFSFISGNSYSFSVFYKANGRNFIQIEFNTSAFPTSSQGVFDVGNGTVNIVGAGLDSASIKDFGNGWYRCTATTTSDVTTNALVAMYVSETASISYQGDGVSGGFIWGAQLEEQTNSTSYIPTSAATNTRNQDIATNSGNATLINSTEGVLYAEIAALADGVNGRYISIGDGSLSNYVYIRITGILNEVKMGVIKGGSTQASKSFTVPNLKQSNKLAVSYQQDLFRFYVNGTLIFTDTNGDIFPIGTLNALTFNLANTNNYFNGKNKCLAVYKEALTSAELQSLTTI